MSTSGGSFIPKRSTGKVTPVRAGRRIYILSYIAYVLFFGTLLSVVGIFFLDRQAQSQLDEYILLVNEQRQPAIEDQIATIRTLDNRLSTAEKILEWHLAPSILFTELESIVAETVQLDSFNYSRNTGEGVTLEFGGSTESFDVLLFQRQVMEASELFAAADITAVDYGANSEVIQGLNRDTTQANDIGDATVSFTFTDEEISQHIGYAPQLSSDSLNVDSQDIVVTDDSENVSETEGVTEPVTSETIQ